MKKLFVFGLFMMSAAAASAQSVKFGMRAGMNVSWESDHFALCDGRKEVFTNDMRFRTGLDFGAFALIPTGEKLELEAGLGYSVLGYRDEVMTSFEPLNSEGFRITSNYLTIPIAEKFYPSGEGFYVELGPQFSFLLSKKETFDRDVDDFAGFEMLTDNTHKVDVALLGGVGYQFTNSMFVNARYIHGFVGTSKVYSGGKNRNFQISLGYIF